MQNQQAITGDKAGPAAFPHPVCMCSDLCWITIMCVLYFVQSQYVYVVISAGISIPLCICFILNGSSEKEIIDLE